MRSRVQSRGACPYGMSNWQSAAVSTLLVRTRPDERNGEMLPGTPKGGTPRRRRR